MKKQAVFLALFLGILTISLAAYVARIYRPGRYMIQTVTYKNTSGISGNEFEWKVCLKIDSLTGRAWVLEGSNVKTHSDMYFREIPCKSELRSATAAEDMTKEYSEGTIDKNSDKPSKLHDLANDTFGVKETQ